MTRRQFNIAIVTALSTVGCALKLSASPKPPTGTVCGHVFGRGLRFGHTTEYNPSGHFPTTFVVPGAYLLIFDMNSVTSAWGSHRLVDKRFTDEQGYFEMELPSGSYSVKYPAASPAGATGFQKFRVVANKITVLGLS